MGSRWKLTDEYTTTKCTPPPRISVDKNEVGYTQSNAIGWNNVTDRCTRLLQNKMYISLTTALIVLSILVIAKPPFVCKRQNSLIDNDHYTEKLSIYRLAIWSTLAFTVVYMNDTIRSIVF